MAFQDLIAQEEGSTLAQGWPRWAGAAVMFGGALWTLSALLNVSVVGGSADGTRFGLSEGNARALLNLSLIMFLPGVFAFYQELATRSPFTRSWLAAVLAAAGLILMLLGNLLEFGPYGNSPIESQDPGFMVFTLGVLVTIVGLSLFIRAALRARVLRGIGLVAALAFPPATLIWVFFGVPWMFWGYRLWRR